MAPAPDCGESSPACPSTLTSDSNKMAETSDTTAQLQNLRAELQKHSEKALAKGESWYLLDNHWYKQLKGYIGLDPGGEIGQESANPGPIDNGPLFKDDSSDIRDHMIDELDYTLVPEEAWTLLVERFGLSQNQEPIRRKVVEHGMFVKHCKVEVYFIEFQLAENANLEDIRKKKFSKSDTLEHIQSTMRAEFNIAADSDVRLWNKYSSNTFEQLSKLDHTVQDAGLFSGQLIIIEVKNEDGSWPRQSRSLTNGDSSPIPLPPPQPLGEGKETSPAPATASSSKYTFSGSGLGEVGQTESVQPGVCGLSNLGNTCFMNSIIQGLSNTPAITEYFDNDNYLEDINEDNPLGMKGEIARTFGQLIKDMWGGKHSYVVPRAFKMAVGRFAPQFSGYQQQDSQELLTFLLDGLHEDLNRVRQKPYVEMGDCDGKPDSEVAMEAWQNYKKRNDSVILDIFHGLLKSTVVCPECPKVSVTFDPTCYLSLPLPVKKERQVELFLVHLDPLKSPTQFKVSCPKNGTMADLCQALSKLADVPAESLVVTDVYNHRFHKIYTGEDQLSQILDRDDIFVYQMDISNPDLVTVPVYLTEKKSGCIYYNWFGQPLLASLPKSCTVLELYSALLLRMSRCLTRLQPRDEIDTASMEKQQEIQGPVKMFSLSFVNIYGCTLKSIDSTADDSTVSLNAKKYLSLYWPKSEFFNKKAAEEFDQDDSYHDRPNPRIKQRTMLETENMKTDQHTEDIEKISNEMIVSLLKGAIEENERSLECPVCLEVVEEAPIYRCQQEHLVCSTCRPQIRECPECREDYEGEPVRHRFAEKMAQDLLRLRELLSSELNSHSKQ